MVEGDAMRKNSERRFPDQLWPSDLIADPTAAARHLPPLAAAAVARGGPPRELALGCAYLKANLPPGICWIYACGTHSQAIAHIPEESAAARLAGFVDVKAAEIGEFLGYRVISPQDLLNQIFDYVIVGHLQYENDFADALISLGVPEEKIVRIYGGAAYREPALAASVDKAAMQYAGPYDTIIVTSNSLVLSDSDLCEVFDREKTLVLYYGPRGQYTESPFPILNVHESLDFLYQLIEFYKPLNIYVRTFFDHDAIVYSIRQRRPDAIIIHEPFDLSIVFPPELLTRWNKWSLEQIQALQWAECDSFKTSDFIVSKRGGPCWDKIVAPFNTPFATVFSRLTRPELEEPARASGEDLRVVYAGFLPPETRHLGGYYDLYPCFEKLVRAAGVTVDIYNAGHLPGDYCDSVYDGYLSRDYGGKINYNRSLPYDLLIRQLMNYDFGWLYNERSEIYIHDAAVTIPGRVTGYISAGVPVIIDDEFEFLADLITRFNAGIVVPEGRTERIPELILNADRPAMRAGTRRLRDYMFRQNQEALSRLRNLMKHPHNPAAPED